MFNNSFDHKLVPYYQHGPRYFICSECQIVLYIDDYCSGELYVSLENKKIFKVGFTQNGFELDLTCAEIIIKNILE